MLSSSSATNHGTMPPPKPPPKLYYCLCERCYTQNKDLKPTELPLLSASFYQQHSKHYKFPFYNDEPEGRRPHRGRRFYEATDPPHLKLKELLARGHIHAYKPELLPGELFVKDVRTEMVHWCPTFLFLVAADDDMSDVELELEQEQQQQGLPPLSCRKQMCDQFHIFCMLHDSLSLCILTCQTCWGPLHHRCIMLRVRACIFPFLTSCYHVHAAECKELTDIAVFHQIARPMAPAATSPTLLAC